MLTDASQAIAWVGSALAAFLAMQFLLRRLYRRKTAQTPEQTDPESVPDKLRICPEHQPHNPDSSPLPCPTEGLIPAASPDNANRPAGPPDCILEKETVEFAVLHHASGLGRLRLFDGQHHELAGIRTDDKQYAIACSWLRKHFGDSLDITLPEGALPGGGQAVLLWRKKTDAKKINARRDESLSAGEAAKLLAGGFRAWPGADLERTPYITPRTVAWNSGRKELQDAGIIREKHSRTLTACPVQIGALTLDLGAECSFSDSSPDAPLASLDMRLHLSNRADQELQKISAMFHTQPGNAANAPEVSASLDPVSRRIHFQVKLLPDKTGPRQ